MKIFFVLALFSCTTLFLACNSNQGTETKPTTAIDSATIANKKFDLAYQSDDRIVASSIDTLKQISFGGASDPAISPDGNKLAYTVNDSAGHRTIWLADLQNKSQMQLQVNNDNYYQAMWSPNGDKIAFNIFSASNIWKVGLINADNSGFVILDNNSNIMAYSPTWKNDKEIVAQDLKNLYTFNTSGKITNIQSISQLIGTAYLIASSNRFFYTKDGKQLVFNAGNDDEYEGAQGPIEAVYILNLSSKKIQRISPKGINVGYMFLTADDRIFYSGDQKPVTDPKIYVSDLDGNIEKVVEKGDNPSGALK